MSNEQSPWSPTARVLMLLVLALGLATATAGTLTGSYASIPENSIINLSEAGVLDWVHWGLHSEGSLNRKANVTPRISDFTTVANTNGSVVAYQFADNFNGYSWSDGAPLLGVTNTTTGVWTYGVPIVGAGFEISVPADTTVQTLMVYVGAFAARGRFEAELSDNSAASYSDTSLANLMGNGPSGTYTITYAAGSAGETLRIRWTLVQGLRPEANVTLQATALTAVGANNPPSVQLTGPANNATFAAPAGINLSAVANDLDGSITRVEFYANDIRLAEDNDSPYGFSWDGVQPGLYSLKALAYDNGGAVSQSTAIEVFVDGTGGSLTAGVAAAPPTVNLTTTGTADWLHWGLGNNSRFNRKNTTTPQLGTFVVIGDNSVERYDDNFTGFSWSDGTPRASASDTHTGVFVTGLGQGFALALPADTTTRTVKVYAGLYGAQGNFQAYLNDFSGPAYTDESLDNVSGNSYAVYTITYAAASAGRMLHIRYRTKGLYDAEFGNVTLQAVTLVGGTGISNAPPVVSLVSPTNNASFVAPASLVLAADAIDDSGVAKVEFFQGQTKLAEDATGPSPYSVVWNNIPPGNYTLTARATDNFGMARTSEAVRITVVSPPQAVTLLNPAFVGTAFTFSFASQQGQAYDAQSTTELDVGWQTLAILTGNGSTITVTNSDGPTGQRFYRVLSK